MNTANPLNSFFLCIAITFGSFLNANAQPSGVEADEDLGGGWSFSNTYGAFYELGSGWNYSDWFGVFYTQDGNWFWRPGFGWTYLFEQATPENWWIYVAELSDWCWTSDDVYPFVNSTNAGGFVWFDQDILGFYNSATGQYASAGVNTVDIILTNTGIDQASWNSIVTQVSDSLSGIGGENFFQLESSSNRLVFRYNFGSQASANFARNALQALAQDYGIYTISID